MFLKILFFILGIDIVRCFRHSYSSVTRSHLHSPVSCLYAKRNKRKGLTAESDLLLKEETSSVSTSAGENLADPLTSESSGSVVDESIRAKLKVEIASPFRKLRQFFYVAMGAAGALGTITSVPQMLLAVQGATEKGSVSDIALNIAIDLGAIVGAVLLWDREASAEKAKLAKFSLKEKQSGAKLSEEDVRKKEEFLAKLPVEIQVNERNETMTRIVSLQDLMGKGKQNIVVVTGSSDFVKEAVISARIEGSDLFTSRETYVIPVIYQPPQQRQRPDDSLEASATKGFGSKENIMNAPYIGKPTQVTVWWTYLQEEFDLAESQGAKDVLNEGLVLAVKNNGRVVRRGLGRPPWKEVCALFDEKPV